MTSTELSRLVRLSIGAGALALLALPAAHAQTTAGPRADEVTYTKHVAPILQAKCQVCHRPNSIAPMSLLTYDSARKYARRIKSKVSARLMPPWHIDKTVGVQEFKNDRSLTDTEIETLVNWVDNGTPLGSEADLPRPIDFPDGTRWQLAEKFGAPDLVIRSTPYTMPARAMDKWFRPETETGVTEPRWVRAIEIKPVRPQDSKIVHHVLALLIQQEQGVTGLAAEAHEHQRSAGLFMEWAVGKVGEIFAPDAGKLMLPGSKIRWEVHMHAIGEEFKDSQVELAVYFYPKDMVPKNRTVLRMFDVSRGSQLDIPPNEMAMTQNFYVMQAPSRIENFQPHMHMRGKALTMEAIYPDGRREVLSSVDKFQWNWHVNYVYADNAAPLLPKGTVLVFTAWHDNTAANAHNPDPKQWVGWGDRTVDEMAHVWVDVTYLDQVDFDKETAKRKTAKAAKAGTP